MAPSDSDNTGPVAGRPATSRPHQTHRRSLRAVFAADVVGFSGRMSLNETSTVNALSEIRAIGRRALEEHDGWLFGMPGDGLFALFESAVSAVQCALAMQQDMAERPYLGALPLRIGIHLGEVLIDNGLPYGEALNIAARLEALADPGGILVSGTVMDAVSARVSARFEDRGVPQLKNIPRRIPTFAVKPPPPRSSGDETVAGRSTLDRTMRLDNDELRQALNDSANGQNSAPRPSSPVPARAAEPAPTASQNENEAQVSILVDVPLSAEPEPHLRAWQKLPEQPSAIPAESAADAAPSLVSPAPPSDNSEGSLADQLNRLPNDQPQAAPSHQLARPPHAPVIMSPPLEKTLPDAVSIPDAISADDASQSAAGRPTPKFIAEIKKALAVHVGPFAKLIVDREMASKPSVFELITKLEKSIPNEDERMIFRVRASQINLSLGGSGDDRS